MPIFDYAALVKDSIPGKTLGVRGGNDSLEQHQCMQPLNIFGSEVHTTRSDSVSRRLRQCKAGHHHDCNGPPVFDPLFTPTAPWSHPPWLQDMLSVQVQ